MDGEDDHGIGIYLLAYIHIIREVVPAVDMQTYMQVLLRNTRDIKLQQRYRAVLT